MTPSKTLTMNNYKLEKGKVLRKCKVCEGVGTWWAQPELPEHPYEVMCNECKGGYIEYKEPQKPKYFDKIEQRTPNYSRVAIGIPSGYNEERKVYQTQLKHWQEVKRLLEVEKPKLSKAVLSNWYATDEIMKPYEKAQTRLEELYKEHNV